MTAPERPADETQAERDLRALQERFGPPQPRDPQAGQLPLLGGIGGKRVRKARGRRTE